jgi:hypothetical protein
LDDGNTIWLGLAAKGLFRFSRETKTAVPVPGAPGEICSNHVTRMTRFGGRQVAGTFDNGACVLVDGAWRMLEGLSGQYVHGVAGDGKFLWIAGSNGIARYDIHLQPSPLNDRDPQEVRWFAASAVTALAETKNGIALGSPWGVVRVTRKEDTLSARFISRFRGAPLHLTSIVQAQNGLFVSSEVEGVRFVGEKQKNTRLYLDPVHLPEAWVIDVSAASGGFWAATCQHGVSFVDNEAATFVDASKGLADNRTVGVAAYGKGAFVATLAGLSYAGASGTAVSPFIGFFPDPRGSMVTVKDNILYFGTESGTAVYEIEP